VTFNAVGIGQNIGVISESSRVAYNSTDHVNSFDFVGNSGLQLGQTVLHQHGEDIDYSKVDFTALSTMLVAKYEYIFNDDLIAFKNKISEIKASITAPYEYADTYSVYTGFFDFYGIAHVSAYHNLSTFVDHDGGITSEISQSDPFNQLLALPSLYNFINALNVVAIAKNVDHNYTSDSLASTSVIGGVYIQNGVYYYSTVANINTVPGDTYSYQQVAFANGIINKYKSDLLTGKLAQSYTELQQAIVANVRRVDPLIFDLDGDGIETLSLSGSSAFFDLDNNGLAENTSWVAPDDGLLVLDRNENGIIDNANELFGDQTLLSDGVTYASSGFAALAEFDENNDGVIDALDSIYTLLRIWQDLDSDGVTDSGELKTLAQLGIVSIGLTFLNTGFTDGANNIQVRAGEYTKDDDSKGTVGEYLFDRNTRNSIEESLANVPVDIQELPNIAGAGEVVSLWKAMVDDTSGDLQGLVEDFIAETDAATRHTIFQEILYKWAGVNSIDPSSRGGLFDAQKLAIIEEFLGTEFTNNPAQSAAVVLLEASYAKIYDALYADLISQTHLSSLLSLVTENVDGSLSFDDVISEIDDQLSINESDGLSLLNDFSTVIRYYGFTPDSSFVAFRNYYALQSIDYARAIDLAGSSVLRGTAGSDYYSTDGRYTGVDGGDGDDTISINTTSNVALYGGAGNDTITASSGNDILAGGTGTDILRGMSGNDTYLYGIGDGADTIADSDANVGNTDTIQFLAGIDPADVAVLRSGDDLILTVGDPANGDTVTIQGYYSDRYRPYNGSSSYYSYLVGENSNKIEQIVFADETVWTTTDLEDKARVVTGTAGDDGIVIYGANTSVTTGDGNDWVSTSTSIEGGLTVDTGNGDDYVNLDSSYNNANTITTGAGNDTIYTGSGGSTVDAGAGDDLVYGGSGEDTYYFNENDGFDTITDYGGTDDKIIFEYGPSDLVFNYNGNDLSISVADGLNGVTVKYWNSNTSYQVETLQASDGSTLASTQVDQLIQAMATYSGNNNNISWQDALQQNPQDVQSILSQFWVSTN
jgi:Ca2+-binding RTX toxin-like protein